MPSIADTIRRFQAAGAGANEGSSAARTAHLEELASFGTNPGALRGWCHVPTVPGSPPIPLVVVLHGCTQTAAGYDAGSGWTDLATRFGFAVLFPEQQRRNNANLCFNWFAPEDQSRDAGEALSIRQMVGAMLARFAIDAGRVYVSGLSAGGAMANVMLATYPELFAGGSIIAGLPYGSASSVADALERMRGAGHPSSAAYAQKVRRASPHTGPWPRVTVWHGDADHVVNVANADAIVGQWRIVHGAAAPADRTETVGGRRYRAWLGQAGEVAVEEYRIAGLGHGTPLKTSGHESCGTVGPHMLEAGISSTWHQAQSWGLLQHPLPAEAHPAPRHRPPREPNTFSSDVTATIEGALRSAGLMR